MTAILEVPFLYEAVIIRPRHRREERVRPLARTAVRIREDAWHGRLAEAARRGDQIGLGWTLLPKADYAWMAVPEDEIPCRRWVSDNRAEREAEIRHGLERGAAFVDGVLFVPSLDPAWIVKASVRAVAVRAEPEYGFLSYHHGTDQHRGDHLPSALAEARRQAALLRAGGWPDCPAEPRVLGAIEILDAAAFRVDDRLDALRHAARVNLSWLRKDIADADPAMIRAYADLKQIVEAKAADDGLAFDSLLMTAVDLKGREEAALRAVGRQLAPHHPIADFLTGSEAARSADPQPDLDGADLEGVDLGAAGFGGARI